MVGPYRVILEFIPLPWCALLNYIFSIEFTRNSEILRGSSFLSLLSKLLQHFYQNFHRDWWSWETTSRRSKPCSSFPLRASCHLAYVSRIGGSSFFFFPDKRQIFYQPFRKMFDHNWLPLGHPSRPEDQELEEDLLLGTFFGWAVFKIRGCCASLFWIRNDRRTGANQFYYTGNATSRSQGKKTGVSDAYLMVHLLDFCSLSVWYF